MKKTALILSLFLVLSYLSNVFSQPALSSTLYGTGRGIYAANLNLTADQLSKINNLRNAFHNETLSLRTDLQNNQLKLRTLMVQPAENKATIIALQKEVSGIHQKLQEKALNFRIEARKVLTPEQIALLPAGYGFGFGLGINTGLGYGTRSGYGRGMNGGYGRGRGRGTGQGRGGYYRSAYCPYRF